MNTVDKAHTETEKSLEMLFKRVENIAFDERHLLTRIEAGINEMNFTKQMPSFGFLNFVFTALLILISLNIFTFINKSKSEKTSSSDQSEFIKNFKRVYSLDDI